MGQILAHLLLSLLVEIRYLCSSVGWLVGWLVNYLVGWLVGWSAGWLVGWLAGWRAFLLALLPQIACLRFTICLVRADYNDDWLVNSLVG